MPKPSKDSVQPTYRPYIAKDVKDYLDEQATLFGLTETALVTMILTCHAKALPIPRIKP